MDAAASHGRQEACKTYIEQTKLLVTLASAFLFAPPGLIGILKGATSAALVKADIGRLIVSESLLVASVLSGYIVLGSLAGTQDRGDFDIFRPATRYLSLLQFGLYIAGLVAFIRLAVVLVQ